MASTSQPFRPIFGMSCPWETASQPPRLTDYGQATHLNEEWRSRLHLTLLLSAVLTFLATYSALMEHVQMADTKKPISWARALFSEFTYSYAALALSPLVVMFMRRYPLGRKHWRKHILLHLLAMLVFSSVARLVWDFVAGPLFGYPHSGFTLQVMFRSIVYYSDFGG